MSTALEQQQPRKLGLRAQPALQLSIGAEKPTRGPGQPIDHFRPKPGENNEFARAAARFIEIYGDKPKAIDVLLGSSMGWTLDIRYRAWGAGGLRAIGQTNWTEVGDLGGPDTITIYDPDGSKRDTRIGGTNDPAAQELELGLETVLRFHIPAVLGMTAFAILVTKSARSTDNLYRACAEMYAKAGQFVPEVFRPKLLLREGTMRPVVQTKDGPRRMAKPGWFLDLYVSDTWDEVHTRLSGRIDAARGLGELTAPPPPPVAIGPTVASATSAHRPTPSDPAYPGDEIDNDPYEPIEGEIVDDEDSPAEKPSDQSPAESDKPPAKITAQQKRTIKAELAKVTEEAQAEFARLVPKIDDLARARADEALKWLRSQPRQEKLKVEGNQTDEFPEGF